MSEWDVSLRSEALGEFCRIHAFYDCPLCKGEEEAWVIPIVDSRSDAVTGEVTVRASGQVTITGHPSLPEPQTVVVQLPAVSERDVGKPELGAVNAPGSPRYTDERRAALGSRSLDVSRSETAEPTVHTFPSLPRVRPSQVRSALALFSTGLDLTEPRHVEAAARGRAIHDAAVTLSEAEGISYADAIQRILDERA